MEQVTKRIEKVLCEIDEEIAAYEGEDLFSAGLLDSFAVIDLVANLENEFGINIEARDILRENFSNKRAIVKLMSRLLQKEASAV